MPDLNDDGDEDEMTGPSWPPRGQNRGQRKQQSDNTSNENSEATETNDQHSSINPLMESKSEQSLANDETTSPVNDTNDDENLNIDDKQERTTRSRISRGGNQQQSSMNVENRGRRYYDGNTNSNANNNPNSRRPNDRSSWQDRSGNNANSGSNTNTNTNQRFRSDTGSSANHGPPPCKFFLENRCMKVSIVF